MAVGLVAMPFSSIFTPTVGRAHLQVPLAFRNGGGAQHVNLDPGVSQVIITWSGYEEVVIRHYYNGGQWRSISRIPASTSADIRTSGVLTLSSETEHSLAVVTSTSGLIEWDPRTLDKKHVVGVQVIPLSTPGGV